MNQLIRRYLVTDPAFSEYVYNCMATVPKERILQLDSKEIVHFRSQNKMRIFADNATLEERLYMLSRLHFTFTITVAPERYEIEEIMEKLSLDATPDERIESIEDMAKRHIFVLSSREFMRVTQLAAMNSHSQVYVLNYDYVNLHRKLKAKTPQATYTPLIKEGLKGLEATAEIALTALIHRPMIESITGLTEFDLSILLTLYGQRNSYIALDKIAARMDSKRIIQLGATMIGKRCVTLYRLGHIDAATVGINSKSYAIMDSGIALVHLYLQYIINKSSL